jgi:hypothetical protein
VNDLTTPPGFRALLGKAAIDATTKQVSRGVYAPAGAAHCGRCGGVRSVDAILLFSDHAEWSHAAREVRASNLIRGSIFGPKSSWGSENPPPGEDKFPFPRVTLARVTCRQCSEVWALLLISEAEEGADRVMVLGGQSLPILVEALPANVAELLAEANACLGAGAVVGGLAMLRATVEAVLHHQGIQGSMLGKKLATLEDAIERGDGPVWAQSLDVETIRVLKDLGNWAIHTEDFAPKSSVLDRHLAMGAMVAAVALMESVYVRPSRQRQLVSQLRAAIPERPKRGASQGTPKPDGSNGSAAKRGPDSE